MNAHFNPAFQAEASDLAAPSERSGYRRSRGADPVATIGALVVGLATVGAFAVMHPAFVKKQKRDATVVTMLELPAEPPAAEETPPPPPATPPPQPAVTAPVPVVALAVTQTMSAPPPVPQPSAAKAAPSAAPAVVAKGPENVGDLSAQVVFRKPIRVPLESRRQHEEGVVVLAVLLSTDGRVANISIASSSGFPRLDEAALEAVSDWRWSPLVRGGEPVMVRGMVRIPFIRDRDGRGDGGRGRHGRGRHGDREDGPRSDGPDGPGADDRT